MRKKILGLDLGSNSLGWALLASNDGQLSDLIDAGVRIFPKAVEEKTPTPKNQKRRNSRMARRTIQRRARRKRHMENFLLRLNLLPGELQSDENREGILNGLGDPYQLRAKALDEALKPHELGRALLHLVQRRGFLSNKKTLLGRDMLDDPDVLAVLNEEETSEEDSAEESAFKADISQLRASIKSSGCRTLGEYLSAQPPASCKRNRDEQHLRTDRQMYREELALIFATQAKYHPCLTEEAQEKIEHIIFHQRPLKLKKGRVGKCSLEPRKKRAAIARLEYQRFRYLQDINNLKYFDTYSEQWNSLTEDDRKKLCNLFEKAESISFAKIRKTLGLDKKTEFNLESGGVKKLRGNTTACSIREAFPQWDDFNSIQQITLAEDLLSIKKKSALKQRLIRHWGLGGETAVQLCMVELEPDYGSVSLKAINKLIPFLEQGMIYSDARISAGYDYEQEEITPADKLGPPPELPNPIVNKGLHELKRVVNALVAEYGKPDVIRIEMARDLEMNTKRYKDFASQQKKNTKANDKAVQVFQDEAKKNPRLKLSKYPNRDQKIRYRLWEDQNYCCAYSGQPISRTALFSSDVEIDHIIPYSQSLNDSYMNKVVCFARENQFKGQRTPIDAFGGNQEKWEQITQSLSGWDRKFSKKRDRFYQRGDELDTDFINSQLNDTRYISKEAGKYLRALGCDVTYTRGVMTSWLRRSWELNELIGETDKKERTDHRHHTIDAIVTACIDRPLYTTLVEQSRSIEKSKSQLSMNDIYIDPPFPDLKKQVQSKLSEIIVSHAPQRKVAGALHEETAVGFIDGIGTVYRKKLTPDFTLKNAESIIDNSVKNLVVEHLGEHGNEGKIAFAEGFKLFHKDGKTPIKKVRVLQSKTTLETLEKNKFPIKDKSGKPFKWYAYGNTHHVEILRKKSNPEKISAHFVTAMEASQRALKQSKESSSVINTKHGEGWEFLMALHSNDLVTVNVDGEQQIHRIQKLNAVNSKIATRLHTSAVINKKSESIEKSAGTLVNEFKIMPISVNVIGKRAYD